MAALLGSIIGPWATEDIYVPSHESILVRITGLVEAIPYSVIAFAAWFSWIPFVINLVLLGWCFFILSIFKFVTKEDIQVFHGAQRVTYFSAFFQFTFFFVFTYLPGFFVNPYSEVTVGSIVFWSIVFILAAIRVVSVFQGMRLEAKGSVLVGFLSTVPCADVWYALANLIFLGTM